MCYDTVDFFCRRRRMGVDAAVVEQEALLLQRNRATRYVS